MKPFIMPCSPVTDSAAEPKPWRVSCNIAPSSAMPSAPVLPNFAYIGVIDDSSVDSSLSSIAPALPLARMIENTRSMSSGETFMFWRSAAAVREIESIDAPEATATRANVSSDFSAVSMSPVSDTNDDAAPRTSPRATPVDRETWLTCSRKRIISVALRPLWIWSLVRLSSNLTAAAPEATRAATTPTPAAAANRRT